MKLTLLGSVGNINQVVIPELVKQGHEVTVITSSEERTEAIKQLGAKPAVGTMQDVQFLTEQFTGADAVYLMISGNAGAEDLFKVAEKQGQIFKQAVKEANVKNVVDLSSVGADAGEIAGALYAYYLIEGELKQLDDVNIAFVRPVGFYNNWYGNLQTIKTDKAIYSNIAKDLKRANVAPVDIAQVVLPLLLDTPKGHTVHYAISDLFTGEEFVAALNEELGEADIRYVEISDEQFKHSLSSRGIPEKVIEHFLQMNEYERQPEKAYADLKAKNPSFGKIKLEDFIKQFVYALNNPTNAKANTIVSE
ncbi:NAD(P)H-binding protein [Listeria sp. PSOL-1]|uniref:NmrA family NAD(P)-binding protein n=1 Tax=Listeria sp. PSOL-1 TaxID=1844999 RepID=UPI0013D213B0|nr:NAD(P)H-binding protein [Listeria sp. PSOL-1]